MVRDDTALQEFLEKYPPRPYQLTGGAQAFPPEQLAQVEEDDGLFLLNDLPPSDVALGRPRQSRFDQGEHCHLWVIDGRGRPCIAERPIPRLGDDCLHHTNLTGGGQASIGGEIWFDKPSRIYLSGGSGRYPPRDHEHLQAAEELFRAVGFEVVGLGWDIDTGQAMRVWRPQNL